MISQRVTIYQLDYKGTSEPEKVKIDHGTLIEVIWTPKGPHGVVIKDKDKFYCLWPLDGIQRHD